MMGDSGDTPVTPALRAAFYPANPRSYNRRPGVHFSWGADISCPAKINRRGRKARRENQALLTAQNLCKLGVLGGNFSNSPQTAPVEPNRRSVSG
jgi:hypothetical protein